MNHRPELLGAKAAKKGGDRAHHDGMAREFCRRISKRSEDTLDVTMEIIWVLRKVLALNEGVFLVEKEAMIECMEDKDHEAGCAREALTYRRGRLWRGCDSWKVNRVKESRTLNGGIGKSAMDTRHAPSRNDQGERLPLE
jgi:hypothetical protein